MRYWLPLFFIIACDDDATFSKDDVDKAFVAMDYERACRGVRSANDEVRSHAASRLSTVSDPEATECICAAMDNGSGGWDEAILQGLQDSESEALGACFVELVQKSDLKNRSGAVNALGTLRSKAASQAMAGLLEDDSLDAMARVSIIESLPRRSTDAPLLVDIMKNGGDTSLQAAAAKKLSADIYPDEEINEALLESTRSENTELRIAAISTLRERKSDQAGGAIRDAVNDEDMEVRAAIFYLLAGTEDDFEVRQLVDSAETELTTPGARDALLYALVETGCKGRKTEARIQKCKGGSDDAKAMLCDAIPYWVKTYMDSDVHLDTQPKGTDIIGAQNEADPNLTISCLEDIIKNRTAEMSCFGSYYVKYWYAENILGEKMTALDTEKEVRFNLKLDMNHSYQLKACEG